jgi:hypothetical protein
MYKHKSRGSAVSIATGYRLDNLQVGVRVQIGSRIVTSPYRPDRLWGPPNLFNRYTGLLPEGGGGGVTPNGR